jgi:hypothetical protein
VNTDVIFPGKYTYTLREPNEIAAHALEDLDPGFAAQAQPGDIVVALLDDDATVKRFLQTPDGYVLQPENPNYAPIPLRPDGPTARIVGKVNGVLRLPHLN